MNQFRELIASYSPGTRVDLLIVRNRKRMTKTVQLAEFPQEQAQTNEQREEVRPWLGIHVRELTSAEQRALGADRGVVVERVDPGSPADEAGIISGDVILKVGETEIRALSDYRAAEKSLSDTDRAVLLYIRRGSEKLFVAVELQR